VTLNINDDNIIILKWEKFKGQNFKCVTKIGREMENERLSQIVGVAIVKYYKTYILKLYEMLI